MHENKFRAWDTITKKMEYFDLDDLVWNFDTGYFVGYDLSFNPLLKTSILMQNTDLKDKTGKEIYEGDICEIDAPRSSEKEERMGIKIAVKDFLTMLKEDNLWFWEAPKENIKIVNTIYENPELLK